MAKDITNQRFSKLVALKKVGRKENNALWECICDCGKTTVTTTTSLIGGNTKSCGCLQYELAYNRREVFVGKTFGSLTVIKDLENRHTKRYVWVKCVCGVEKAVSASAMKYGKIISCGCVGAINRTKASIKHGLSYNRLYFVWASMMDRCYKETFPDYHNYGGRGIKVSDEWHDVRVFISDMQEGSEKGLQLDRIDNNGWYSKQNCRWVTRKQNNRNKRNNVFITINNEIKTAKEWSEIYNVRYNDLRLRFHRGEDNEQYLIHGRPKIPIEIMKKGLSQ